MKKAFTLVELLIVIVILGILATMAVPQYQSMIEKAQTRQALIKLSALRQAEQAYYLQYGIYAAWGWLPAPVPSDGGTESGGWTGVVPSGFSLEIASDKYFTYKALKETAWPIPGNFHVGAYKRMDPGKGWYYYMDVENGNVYKAHYPSGPDFESYQ